MSFRRYVFLACLAVVPLAACSVFKKPEKPDPNDKPESQAPQLVGRIASIPQDKRFVLIQSYNRWNIETGTILTTRGPEERTANLRVTGESLGQFAAADLQSGAVEVGDAVYSLHIPKPVETVSEPSQSPELPEIQKTTDN